MPSEKQYLDLLVKPERDPYHHEDHPSDFKKHKLPTKEQPVIKPRQKLDYTEYMDLDEFVSTTPRTSKAKADDKNKSSVDLLASLVALGKIIAERQSKALDSLQLQPPQTNAVSTGNRVTTSTSIDLSGFQSSSSSSSSKESEDISDISSRHSNSSTSVSGSNPSFSSGSDPYVPKARNRRFIIPGDMKDSDYWSRRERNNRAARKSREQRRMKEMDVLNLVKKMEDENTELTSYYNRLQSLNTTLEKKFQLMMERKKYSSTCCNYNSSYSRGSLLQYNCS